MSEFYHTKDIWAIPTKVFRANEITKHKEVRPFWTNKNPCKKLTDGEIETNFGLVTLMIVKINEQLKSLHISLSMVK